MYGNKIVATAVALAGSAIAQSLGSAVVVNSCDYPVYLQNTPSAGGGFSAISQTLDTGASYTQEWTELTNGNGWSLKLSKDEGLFEDNVMQYEYTWHGWEGAWGGVIWFDLSDVNGNPWDGNWELTATGECTPRQAAYQFSTDDAYGMQSCPGGSSITVELCSGSSAGTGGSSAVSSMVESATSAVTSVVSALQSTETAATGGFFAPQGNSGPLEEAQRLNANGQDKKKPTPTTMATVVSSAINRGGVTVTEVATQVVTNFVTATAAAPHKRHEHIARHAHHHHF